MIFCVWNWFRNWFCNWFFGIDFLGFFGGSLWVRFCSHLATQTAKTNAYHPQSHALSIYTLQWTKNKQFAHNRSSHLCSLEIFVKRFPIEIFVKRVFINLCEKVSTNLCKKVPLHIFVKRFCRQPLAKGKGTCQGKVVLGILQSHTLTLT